MTLEPGPDEDYFYGFDFLEKHNIRYRAWNLGVHEYAHGALRLWTLRIQRTDDGGNTYAWEWTEKSSPDQVEPDWDDAIWIKSRDAADGRLSFDAYITENLGDQPTVSVNRREYRMWVDDTAVWHDARDFLGWDHALIKSFLSIVPNEH